MIFGNAINHDSHFLSEPLQNDLDKSALEYMSFLKNEAKESQSDSVGSPSFGGRGSEWANLEVSSAHAASAIHSRRS